MVARDGPADFLIGALFIIVKFTLQSSMKQLLILSCLTHRDKMAKHSSRSDTSHDCPRRSSQKDSGGGYSQSKEMEFPQSRHGPGLRPQLKPLGCNLTEASEARRRGQADRGIGSGGAELPLCGAGAREAL